MGQTHLQRTLAKVEMWPSRNLKSGFWLQSPLQEEE